MYLLFCYTHSITIEAAIPVPTWKIQGVWNHPSHHGTITGAEAEEILQQHGDTCYLTRYSEVKQTNRLSVMTRKGNGGDYIFSHYDIDITERPRSGTSFEIVGTEKKFREFSELLSFYQTTPVSFEVLSIGTCVVNTNENPMPYSINDQVYVRHICYGVLNYTLYIP